jgi:hypothetical protein
MTSGLDKAVFGMIIGGIILGFILGMEFDGCGKKPYKSILRRDTVQSIQTIERPVFVKPDVRVKQILIPYKDTMYVKEQLPCDSAFIAQADSVITNTGDTIQVAFSHKPFDKSYFSMVVKPRPDSILTRTIEIPIVHEEKSTDIAWIISSFAIGIGIGILGASK